MRCRTADLEWSRQKAVLERLALTVGLVTFFIAGYFGVGYVADPTRGWELATPLDDQIPFVARSVWVYLWAFPAALLPLFVVRCPRLLRRTALAYATVIAVSLVCFAAFPVTVARFRVDSAMLDISRPSDWAVSVVYALAPPCNCFPSLHLSITALAAFSTWKASRPLGAAAFLGVGLVGVSVCTVKQHFLPDPLGGLALAALVDALILRPYDPRLCEMPAYTWRGPVIYMGFLVLVYAGFYVAFLWAL
jgi:membrane-associated phospholipid phosphatase